MCVDFDVFSLFPEEFFVCVSKFKRFCFFLRRLCNHFFLSIYICWVLAKEHYNTPIFIYLFFIIFFGAQYKRQSYKTQMINIIVDSQNSVRFFFQYFFWIFNMLIINISYIFSIETKTLRLKNVHCVWNLLGGFVICHHFKTLKRNWEN